MKTEHSICSTRVNCFTVRFPIDGLKISSASTDFPGKNIETFESN